MGSRKSKLASDFVRAFCVVRVIRDTPALLAADYADDADKLKRVDLRYLGNLRLTAPVYHLPRETPRSFGTMCS